MLSRRRDALIEAGVVLALMLTLAVFFIDQHSDRAYITYRYALNLATGRGLVYNFGQPAFLSGSASAPYAMLLGLGGLLVADIPTMANVFGMIAVGLSAFLITRLAVPAGRLPALLAGFFTLTSPLLWSGVGVEAPLWLALCLAGFAFHLRGSGVRAAICLGLATLIRADAALLAGLLAGHAFWVRRPLVFLPVGVYAGIAGLAGLSILAIFQKGGIQSPYLPAALAGITPDALGSDVLSGLGGMISSLTRLSPLWALALLICAAGLARIRSHPWAMLLAVWAALHLGLLAVLGVAILPRDMTPLIPLMAAMLGLAAELILERVPEGRVHWSMFGALTLLTCGTAFYSSLAISATSLAASSGWRALAAGAADPRIDQAAAWLLKNAPGDASVATTHAGRLGYQIAQPVLDYYGMLQPEIGEAAARGDTGWWLMAYSPGYVVADPEALPAQDEWFTANYRQAANFDAKSGSLAIFRRGTPANAVTGSMIGFTTFPSGITVNGIGADFSLAPLESGRSGLIRLEWLLNYPILSPQTVTIRIQGRGGGAVAALATRTVDFSRWPLHELTTTFHPIALAPDLPSGVYDIEVGIGPDAEHQDWKTITIAKVPFQGGTDLGGISGSRAEFGDISLLGYRVGLRPEGLEVFLLWQAATAIAADYHMIVQVRDPNDALVSSQDVQPHNGAYPTSVWSPGEQVTDTILLPVNQIPPGEYDVYIGLATPDGVAVHTADGKDAVFVGHITLASP